MKLQPSRIWRFERDNKSDEWRLVATKIKGVDDKFVYLKTGRLNKANVCFTPEDCLARFLKSMNSAIKFKQRMIVRMVRGIVKAEELLKAERQEKDGHNNDNSRDGA